MAGDNGTKALAPIVPSPLWGRDRERGTRLRREFGGRGARDRDAASAPRPQPAVLSPS